MTTKDVTAAMTEEQLVEKMKAQILALMDAGQIPPSVRSFSELHDYCDANCLGGLCEDETADALIEHFGGRDEHEGMPQGMLDLINRAQHRIDGWLEQHASELGLLEMPDLQPMEVAEFDLYEIVGDYDDARKLEEGAWLEANASYRHRHNLQDGVYDFVLNLALDFEAIPPKLANVIARARKADYCYLIVHAGA